MYPKWRQARLRQSAQRRPRRLATGLCAVSRRCRLCVEGVGFELSVPQGMRARAMLSVDMIWFREI